MVDLAVLDLVVDLAVHLVELEPIREQEAKAQALAKRWSELVRGFTGGDAGVQQGLNKLYADQAKWPSTFARPFSDEVWQYIKQAMAAHKISCA